MAHKINQTTVSPRPIMDDLYTGWRSWTLVSGIELDVFTHMAHGKHTAKEIAQAAGASERGMISLLDALAALGYLRKGAGRYRLQPVAAKFLVRGNKEYMGEAIQPLLLTWDSWSHLTEAVRTGHPHQAVDLAERGKDFFPKLVGGLFPTNFAASQAAVASLSAKERSRIRRILDVAAGSAAWSLAFAKAIPETRVTTLDLPEMAPITRGYAEKLGVANRYEFLEGDLRRADFGRDLYDLVILGHIIHTEGEKHGQELIRKSYAALRPGGLLLIAEFVPNDTRTGPVIPLLFGLNMLLHAEEGSVFTLREYRTWLRAAGFRTVRTIPAPAPSPLILATR